MPVCSKCRQEKPLDNFTKNRSHAKGHNPACKDCDSNAVYKRQFEERGGPIQEPKRCPRCTITKDWTAFRVNSRNKDGLDAYCQSCANVKQNTYYYKNSTRQHHEPIHIRFWRMVNTSGGIDACWPWQGATNEDGYGLTKEGQRSLRAHQLAYELTHGAIPSGLSVLHTCDNPACCNAFKHLWVGTQADNMRDCSLKERTATSLTSEQVRAIRLLEGVKKPSEVARIFSIHRVTVYDIWKRRRFRHIE